VRPAVARATPPRARCAPGGPSVTAWSAGSASWPRRVVQHENPAESVSDQVVDTTAGVAYALVSRTSAPARGPYVLECTTLQTGAVARGPVFRPADVAFAAGYLWVYGPAARPLVRQVSPLSLAPIRSIQLPAVPARDGQPPVAIAAGPGGSVWIGAFQTLLRVSAATGAVLGQVKLPAGLALSDMSVDPAGKDLYVSLAHLVAGGTEGAAVAEYDARSGRHLASAVSGLITDSVTGAQLTAVPGGVWVSFRTGMLGLTVVLRQRDLAVLVPRHPAAVAGQPATSIFHWPMYTTTSYAGGALWLANQVGIVACLDPLSGGVRAMERVPQAQLVYQLLAADPMTRQVFGIGAAGLLRITPPRRCWS
jgi:hypothetical protein